MTSVNARRFNDFWWDTAPPEKRDKAALDQAKRVVLYAKKNVPFYRAYYEDISEAEIKKISTLAEFVEKIPYMTKAHIEFADSYDDFLPEHRTNKVDHFRYDFGTGGTTGDPIIIRHSDEDWLGMAVSANRMIEWDYCKDKALEKKFGKHSGIFKPDGFQVESRITPLKGARIFGAYAGDHITNHIYKSMFALLGAQLNAVPSPASTLKHIYKAKQAWKPNGLLAPPGGGNVKKGTFAKTIFELDAQNTNPNSWDLSHRWNKDFKFLFWSSMPIEKGLLDYFKNYHQIPYIKGFFGSTEICPTGSSCSEHMRTFHLTYCNSLVLIKKLDEQKMAGVEELGYTLVSKIGALDVTGNPIMPTGIYLIAAAILQDYMILKE